VCVTLLGARHVPERLCDGLVNLGRYLPLGLPKLICDVYQLAFGIIVGYWLLSVCPSVCL